MSRHADQIDCRPMLEKHFTDDHMRPWSASSTILPDIAWKYSARAARLVPFPQQRRRAALAVHGAVSRQVSRLERWMACAFRAGSARRQPDARGYNGFARAEEALALLGNTGERWSPKRSRSVACLVTPSVASLWFFPSAAKARMQRHSPSNLRRSTVWRNWRQLTLLSGCGKGPWAECVAFSYGARSHF